MKILIRILICNVIWILWNLTINLILVLVPIRYPTPKITEFMLNYAVSLAIYGGLTIWIISFIIFSYMSREITLPSATSNEGS